MVRRSRVRTPRTPRRSGARLARNPACAHACAAAAGAPSRRRTLLRQLLAQQVNGIGVALTDQPSSAGACGGTFLPGDQTPGPATPPRLMTPAPCPPPWTSPARPRRVSAAFRLLDHAVMCSVLRMRMNNLVEAPTVARGCRCRFRVLANRWPQRRLPLEGALIADCDAAGGQDATSCRLGPKQW